MIEWSTERKPVRFVTNIASMGVIDHFRQHCRLTEPEFGNPNSAWELGWLMGLIRQEAGGDLIAAAVVATDVSGGETLAILNNALITERDGTWWIEPDAFSPEHVVLTSGGQPQEAVEELLREKGWLRPGGAAPVGADPGATPDTEPDAGAVEAKSTPPAAAEPPVAPAAAPAGTAPEPEPSDVAAPAPAPQAPAPQVVPQANAGSSPGGTPLAAAAMPAAAVPEPARAEPSDESGEAGAEDADTEAEQPSAKSRRGHLRLVSGADDGPDASGAEPAGTAEPQVEPQPAGAEAFQPPAPAGPAGPAPSTPGPAPSGPAPAGPARPGQGRPDPGRFQPPGRQDPARVDPFQPSRPDPARFPPPGRPDPRRANPARSDPAARAPGRAGAPGNLDPIRLEDPIPWIEPPDWGEAPRQGDRGSARQQPAPGQPTLLPRQPPTAAPAPEEEPEPDASVPWSDLVNSPPPGGGRGKSRSFLARRATQRRP